MQGNDGIPKQFAKLLELERNLEIPEGKLTFSEFISTSPTPRYNNFFMHWIPSPIFGETKRNSKHYRNFAFSFPYLDSRLFHSFKDYTEESRLFPGAQRRSWIQRERLMYKAYIKMDSTDKVLFT